MICLLAAMNSEVQSVANPKSTTLNAPIEGVFKAGKLALITGQHAYDWEGHYTSASGSVDVYCDASLHETRCTDSAGPSSSLFVELEGEGLGREHYEHTLSPVALFVEGKRTKLFAPSDYFSMEVGYDPLRRLKEDLFGRLRRSGTADTTETFKYRLSTVKLHKDENIAVYCVPFTIEQTRKKKEIGKAAETCYQLYALDLFGRPLRTSRQQQLSTEH
jgi:hypothetical protein